MKHLSAAGQHQCRMVEAERSIRALHDKFHIGGAHRAAAGPSLDGKKQTLAMNYKLIETVGKKFEIKAGYR